MGNIGMLRQTFKGLTLLIFFAVQALASAGTGFRTTLNNTGFSYDSHGPMTKHLFKQLKQKSEQSQIIVIGGNGLSRLPINFLKEKSIKGVLINDMEIKHNLEIRSQLEHSLNKDELRSRYIGFDTGDFSEILDRLASKSQQRAAWLGDGKNTVDVIYLANLLHFLNPSQYMQTLNAASLLLKEGGILYTMYHHESIKIDDSVAYVGNSEGSGYEANSLQYWDAKLRHKLKNRGQIFYGYLPANTTLLHGHAYDWSPHYLDSKLLTDLLASRGFASISGWQVDMNVKLSHSSNLSYCECSEQDDGCYKQMIFVKKENTKTAFWDKMQIIAEQESSESRRQLIRELVSKVE